MKETITPDMINAVQKAVKAAEYDFEKLTINIFGGEIPPCSITQGLFPEIIDLALEHFKRKASHSLTEWTDGPEAKTCNVEITYDKNHRMIKELKNKTLPVFDWSLVI